MMFRLRARTTAIFSSFGCQQVAILVVEEVLGVDAGCRPSARSPEHAAVLVRLALFVQQDAPRRGSSCPRRVPRSTSRPIKSFEPMRLILHLPRSHLDVSSALRLNVKLSFQIGWIVFFCASVFTHAGRPWGEQLLVAAGDA